MPGRKRNVHLHVMVTEGELAAIHARMAEAGISNTGAYVRKMALNGYILHVDLAPVKELVSCQGAGVLAAPLFQQSQSGGGSRQHLRGVPGGNRQPAAGL